MSEHKPEEFTATGRHRAWVGETTTNPVRAGARDFQRNWLDRSQLPPNPRHAAITRSLYNWTSYKNWTDKVRHGWDKDKDKK
jgi:hypothetical protein